MWYCVEKNFISSSMDKPKPSSALIIKLLNKRKTTKLWLETQQWFKTQKNCYHAKMFVIKLSVIHKCIEWISKIFTWEIWGWSSLTSTRGQGRANVSTLVHVNGLGPWPDGSLGSALRPKLGHWTSTDGFRNMILEINDEKIRQTT